MFARKEVGNMDNLWSYIPAAIHFAPDLVSDDNPRASTGIYLRYNRPPQRRFNTSRPSRLKDANNDLVITISPFKQNVNDKVIITTESSIADEEVTWIPSTIKYSIDLLADDPEKCSPYASHNLQKLIKKFTTSGFRFFPNDDNNPDKLPAKQTRRWGSRFLSAPPDLPQQVPLYLVIIKPEEPIETAIPEASEKVEYFTIASLTNYAITSYHQILVKSCPFSVSYPILFNDYHSTGNISYLVKSTTDDHMLDAVLSDVRYLENMEGGIAFLDNTSQLFNNEENENEQLTIGLVAGCFKKLNGQGDLLLIITWDMIFTILKEMFLTNDNKSTFNKLANSSNSDGNIESAPKNSTTSNKLSLPIPSPPPGLPPNRSIPTRSVDIPVTKSDTSALIMKHRSIQISNNKNSSTEVNPAPTQVNPAPTPSLGIKPNLTSTVAGLQLLKVDEYDPVESIVTVTIDATSTNNVYWTTGVLLSSSLVIVNKHVVEPNDSSTLKVWFSDKSFSYVSQIHTQFSDFDFALLSLKTLCSLSTNKPARLPSTSIRKGEKVLSVGLGMADPLVNPPVFPHFKEFIDKEYLQPYISKRVISTTVSLPLFDPNISLGKNTENPVLPIMAVTSSCNGSLANTSGSGLFNAENEFVALSTTNFNLQGTSTSSSDLNLGIPVFGIVDLAFKLASIPTPIPTPISSFKEVEINNKSTIDTTKSNSIIEVNPNIKKCWDLKPIHNDVIWQKGETIQPDYPRL